MTVRELIERLEKFDPGLDVKYMNPEYGEYGGIYEVKLTEEDVLIGNSMQKKTFVGLD